MFRHVSGVRSVITAIIYDMFGGRFNCFTLEQDNNELCLYKALPHKSSDPNVSVSRHPVKLIHVSKLRAALQRIHKVKHTTIPMVRFLSIFHKCA